MARRWQCPKGRAKQLAAHECVLAAAALRAARLLRRLWGAAQSTVVGRQYDRVLLTSLQASRLSRSVPSTLCLRRSAAKFTRTERRLEGTTRLPTRQQTCRGLLVEDRAGNGAGCSLLGSALLWQCPAALSTPTPGRGKRFERKAALRRTRASRQPRRRRRGEGCPQPSQPSRGGLATR